MNSVRRIITPHQLSLLNAFNTTRIALVRNYTSKHSWSSKSPSDGQRRPPTLVNMTVGASSAPLIWIDLEMTGLDYHRDRILEIAMLITDAKLNVISEGPELIIHQPESVLLNMNDWCKQQHGRSGLSDRVRASTLTIEEADKQCSQFVRDHTVPNICPLAGSSVHTDRLFMLENMPLLSSHLHYHIVDVSSIANLAWRWAPHLKELAPKRTSSHRAMDDVKASLELLRFYRDTFFKH